MRHFLLSLLALALLFTACTPIEESQRLIDMQPLTTERVVLLEEFTGQDCVNCPRASQLIHQLQEDYGVEKLIVVGIHSGPYGRWTSSRWLGLRNPLADTYGQHWGVDQQPMGLVNRGGKLLTEYEWGAAIHQALQQPTPLTISLSSSPSQNEGIAQIQIDLQSSEALQGRLQLWIIENNITALQKYPERTEPNYLHQHVLRAAVNGSWGESISLSPGQKRNLSYSPTLDPQWQSSQLSLVAFVYNDLGVLQAATAPLFPQP